MRQGQGRRRGRGGQRPPGQGGASVGRGPEPARVEHRNRGNAAQLLEKYKTLARDAQLQGDRITAEYYLQYADHYFRVLNEGRPRFEEQRGRRDWQDRDEEADGEPAGDEGEEREERAADRPEPRRDRYEGRDRYEPRERFERGDRSESRERSEARDRPERTDSSDRTERAESRDRTERAESRDRTDGRERGEARRDRYDGGPRRDERSEAREPRRDARPAEDRRETRDEGSRREPRGDDRRGERAGWREGREGRGRDDRAPERLNGAEAEHGGSIAAVLPPAFNRSPDAEPEPAFAADAPQSPPRRTRARLSARMDEEPAAADARPAEPVEAPAPRKRGRPRKVVPPEGEDELTFENV